MEALPLLSIAAIFIVCPALELRFPDLFGVKKEGTITQDHRDMFGELLDHEDMKP